MHFNKAVLLDLLKKNNWKYASIFGAIIYALKHFLKKERSLAGKVVLITGAASGLGANLAKRFANLGCDLVLWDIVKEEKEARPNRSGQIRYLDKVKKQIEQEKNKYFGNILTYKVNLANKEQIKRVANQTKKDLGQRKVDIIINNAGIVSGDYITEIDDRNIELTFAINILAHFWIIREFLPAMLKANSGHIVTIASGAGTLGMSKMTDYCSSKYAAVGLGNSLRLELKNRKKSGIKTTLVCPYYINTGMFNGVKTNIFLPILEENYVCKKIIRAIRTDQEVLKMPIFVYLPPLLEFLFPTPVYDWMLTLIGLNSSMDEFHKPTNRKSAL